MRTMFNQPNIVPARPYCLFPVVYELMVAAYVFND